MQRVAGYCPMGCGQTLFLGRGHITCSLLDCPNPGAVDELLAHDETEHILVTDGLGFTIQHPLRERIKGELFGCDIHARVQEANPRDPGRYRVIVHQTDPVSDSYRPGDAGLEFHPIEEAA